MSETTVTTGKVRLSFVHIFEPHAMPGQDAKYSVSVLIPKTDTKTIQAIKSAIDLAKEDGKSKWGGKIPKTLKTPLRDGDTEREDDPNYAGCYFFNCSSKRAPGVVDANLQRILDPDEVYSGCYGRVQVNFYPFAAAGNNGIAAGLQNVQKLSDGERLGGTAMSPEAAFADSIDGEDADCLG